MFNKIYEAILKYDTIILFRHINPDGDALGSQLGLKHLLQATFPNKKIYAVGKETTDDFQTKLFEANDIIEDTLFKGALGIVLDTANHERIDDVRYQETDYIIKIDHHIVVDSYGDINYEDTSVTSTSELIVTWYEALKQQLTLPLKGATYLYTGIVTDSNRFMYQSTSSSTLRLAAGLLDLGVDAPSIYTALYLKEESDLAILAYIYQTYQKTQHGVAYFVFDEATLKQFNITREQAASYVNVLASFKTIPIWLVVTYNVDNYRVSIRSRSFNIQPVATSYQGGGHMYACGATLTSLDVLPQLLADLDKLI